MALAGPVFPVHEGEHRPVSKRTMLQRLHDALLKLGQPSQLYGLHSFRRGGATAAAVGGAPERLIRAHGRWESDVVRMYTYALSDERWALSDLMQASA